MINVGVIGTSWITDEFIKCASSIEDFKLNAVYSRSEEKAKAFADKYGVKNVFTSLEEMAKSNNIHAVYIASYCQYSSRYDFYKEGKVVNTFEPKFSNGSIMDIGIYCIEPLVRLFGKPKDIKASSLKLSSGVDGEGSLILSYEDMDGIIIHSKIANSYLPSEIQGEKGTMIIDKINKPEQVKIIYRSGEIEELSVMQVEKTMYYEAKEFIELINSGKLESKVNSFKQSIISVGIIEEARRQTDIMFPADI